MGGKGSGAEKYTLAVHREIVECLGLGMYRDHAAESAGISRATFVQWIARGERGEAPYAKLMSDARSAQAKNVKRLISVVTAAATGMRKETKRYRPEYKAAIWLLERAHPLAYGARVAELPAPVVAEDKPRSPWLRPVEQWDTREHEIGASARPQ